jgi:hypothetical protein
MMRSLIEKYRAGMITADHLLVESLHMLDPEDPGPVLGPLPEQILRRMLRFTDEFLSGGMLTNYGVLPARDQVIAARGWLEQFFQHPADKTA